MDMRYAWEFTLLTRGHVLLFWPLLGLFSGRGVGPSFQPGTPSRRDLVPLLAPAAPCSAPQAADGGRRLSVPHTLQIGDDLIDQQLRLFLQDFHVGEDLGCGLACALSRPGDIL